MRSPETPAPPLRVLALDGGGIRGLSSLLILENIMDGIKTAKGLEEVPRPCDYFDLIGGTSTGGYEGAFSLLDCPSIDGSTMNQDYRYDARTTGHDSGRMHTSI
jgi:hypothetical protein